MKRTSDYSERKGDYSLMCSSANPQLLILLVNTSTSMKDEVLGESKIKYASEYINRMIDTIICINYDGEYPKNRYYISIVVYGELTEEIKSGFLKELDEMPIRVETKMIKEHDGIGGYRDVEYPKPIWVDLHTSNNSDNNLSAAIDLSVDIINNWYSIERNNKRPFSALAPIVLNITDSAILSEENFENIHTSLKNLYSLKFADGIPLFYNFIITSDEKFEDFPKVEDKSLTKNSLTQLTSKIPYNHQTKVLSFIEEANIVGLSSNYEKILALIKASYRW